MVKSCIIYTCIPTLFPAIRKLEKNQLLFCSFLLSMERFINFLMDYATTTYIHYTYVSQALGIILISSLHSRSSFAHMVRLRSTDLHEAHVSKELIASSHQNVQPFPVPSKYFSPLFQMFSKTHGRDILTYRKVSCANKSFNWVRSNHSAVS